LASAATPPGSTTSSPRRPTPSTPSTRPRALRGNSQLRPHDPVWAHQRSDPLPHRAALPAAHPSSPVPPSHDRPLLMCRSLLSASSLRHSPQVKRLVAPPLSSSQAPRRSATLLKSSASSLRHSPQVKRLVAPPSSTWSCTIASVCTVLILVLHHHRDLHRPRNSSSRSTTTYLYRVDLLLHLRRPAPSSICTGLSSVLQSSVCTVLYSCINSSSRAATTYLQRVDLQRHLLGPAPSSICTVHSSVLQSKICTVLSMCTAPSTRSAPSSLLHASPPRSRPSTSSLSSASSLRLLQYFLP